MKLGDFDINVFAEGKTMSFVNVLAGNKLAWAKHTRISVDALGMYESSSEREGIS